MMEFNVKIISSGGRAVRAIYGDKDISGPGMAKDPIVAEAIFAWGLAGKPDGAEFNVAVAALHVAGEEDETVVGLDQLEGEEVEIVESGDTTEPAHIGGGWYELADGRRVRGEENALKAAAEQP